MGEEKRCRVPRDSQEALILLWVELPAKPDMTPVELLALYRQAKTEIDRELANQSEWLL